MTGFVFSLLLLETFLLTTTAFGTDIVTVELINSTTIGSSQEASGCTCTLDFTVTLTDKSSCPCQPQASGCKQCHIRITTPKDLKIDTGQGGSCDFNNSFPRKTDLHLGVTAKVKIDVLVIPPKMMGTFCHVINLDKQQNVYNISDGGTSSLLMKVTMTSATTTIANTIHTGMASAGTNEISFTTNGIREKSDSADASLSSGAIAGIAVGTIAAIVFAVIIVLVIKNKK